MGAQEATEHGTISPLWAVDLMEQYHQSRLSELRERVEDLFPDEPLSLKGQYVGRIQHNERVRVLKAVLNLIDEL